MMAALRLLEKLSILMPLFSWALIFFRKKKPNMEMFTLLLSVFNQLLEKIPDYNQTKKDKYYSALKEYHDELSMEARDDNRIDNLRDELYNLVRTYSSEIFGDRTKEIQ